MGLLIHTEFETPEGLPVSSVYCRITGLVCDVVSRTEMRVVVKLETFLSRDKRIAGARTLKAPMVPDYSVLTLPLSGEWGSLAYLYAQLKPILSSEDRTVEDVLELEPEPAPAPAPEPAPAPAPEPAPAPAPEA